METKYKVSFSFFQSHANVRANVCSLITDHRYEAGLCSNTGSSCLTAGARMMHYYPYCSNVKPYHKSVVRGETAHLTPIHGMIVECGAESG